VFEYDENGRIRLRLTVEPDDRFSVFLRPIHLPSAGRQLGTAHTGMIGVDVPCSSAMDPAGAGNLAHFLSFVELGSYALQIFHIGAMYDIMKDG
jgi:hypothetical protein